MQLITFITSSPRNQHNACRASSLFPFLINQIGVSGRNNSTIVAMIGRTAHNAETYNTIYVILFFHKNSLFISFLVK